MLILRPFLKIVMQRYFFKAMDGHFPLSQRTLVKMITIPDDPLQDDFSQN